MWWRLFCVWHDVCGHGNHGGMGMAFLAANAAARVHQQNHNNNNSQSIISQSTSIYQQSQGGVFFL
jgi:hypothetical protein